MLMGSQKVDFYETIAERTGSSVDEPTAKFSKKRNLNSQKKPTGTADSDYL
jgi:hypothetical protein